METCTETVFPFQPLCKGLHAVIFWEPLGLLGLWNANSVLNLPLMMYFEKNQKPSPFHYCPWANRFPSALSSEAAPAACTCCIRKILPGELRCVLAQPVGLLRAHGAEQARARACLVPARNMEMPLPLRALLVNNHSSKHRICHLQQLQGDAQQEETPQPLHTTVLRSPHASHMQKLWNYLLRTTLL